MSGENDIQTDTTEQVFKGYVVRQARAHEHVTDEQISDAVAEGDINGLPVTLDDAWRGFLGFLEHLGISPLAIAEHLHRRPVPQRRVEFDGTYAEFAHDDRAIMEPAKKGFLQGFSESMGVADE